MIYCLDYLRKKWIIDLFEIKPDYRGKKLGKEFWEKCLHFFKQKGCDNINLECVPLKSQYFWKKLWFIETEGQSEDKIILSMNLNSLIE